MGSFLAAGDRTDSKTAGIGVGLADPRATQALEAFPGTVWDTANPPTVAADLQWATRRAFNRVGMPDEMADHFVAKLGTGLTGVITIPNVVGMLLPAARAALEAAGARVGTTAYGASAEPLDEVTAQSVVAGASEAGKPVNLTLSDHSL